MLIGTDNGLYEIEESLEEGRKIRQILKERVWCLLKEKDEGIWIGTMEGLKYWDGKDIFQIDEIPKNNVLCLFKDKEENIWIGTDESGMIQMNESKVWILGFEEGLINDNTRAIYENKNGDIFIGTDNGLHILEKGKVKILTKKDGLSSEKINSILVDSFNKVWIGTYGAGLNLIYKNSIKIFNDKDGLCHNVVSSIVEGRDGEIWVGTADGLNLIKDEKIRKFKENDGLPSNIIIRLLYSSDGSLYIGTYGGGLSIFKNGVFKNYSIRDGLPSDKITAIYEDKDGFIWLGCLGGGLARFKDGKFKIVNKKCGLLDDNVVQVLEDDKNNLWIGSFKGIFYFSKKNLDKINCINFTKEDGLKTTECSGGSQPNSFKLSKGYLCFATIKGLAVFDPLKIVKEKIDFPIIIQEIIVDEEGKDINDKIIIPPGKHNIKIKFTGLNFKNSKKLLFKYRLLGFNNSWSEPDKRRIVQFSKIGKGNYKFELMGGMEGEWIDKINSIYFVVKPYFYETTFFKFFLVFLIFLISFSIYKMRDNKIKLKMKHLQEIAEERRKMAEHLNYIAYYDLMTGLPNRLSLIEKMENLIRSRNPFVLFLLNLWHFREIINTYGRDAGDLILKDISSKLRSLYGTENFVSKLEGDEFAILFKSQLSDEEIENIAKEILSNISKDFFLFKNEVLLDGYIGISRYPQDGEDSETILKGAGIALDFAKLEGAKSFTIISMNKSKEMLKRVKLREDIIKGLKRDEFFLYYQPQKDLKENKLFGAEALIRWKKERDTLSPSFFLPVAEEADFIEEIDKFSLQKALYDGKEWFKFFPDFFISINISAKWFGKENFLVSVEKLLKDENHNKKNIIFEITEKTAVVNLEKTVDTIKILKEFGIKFAIDDFGKGYSSLSYLDKLPVQYIKIDKDFIERVPIDKKYTSIVRGIILIYQGIGLSVIAEGVENKEQIDFLKEAGCNIMQGDFFFKGSG